jgi:proteasome lid subunit RPN8/RPN11
MTTQKPTTLRHPDPWPIAQDIQSHAMEAYPLEACGIVVGGEYRRCENIHPEPTKAFRINPELTGPLMAAGQLQAIVHSHPDGPNYPSQPDLEGQINSEIPWGICPVIGDTEKPLYACDVLWWGDTLPPVPLERRKFIWGIFHCYQLYRDWWRQERGMLPPIWPVGDSFIHDGFNCWDTFREDCGLTDMGKIDISNLQIGDMLLGKVRGSFPNHCAVFVGDDKMLHHPPNGVSGTVELLRWWPYVVTVFRNESTSLPSPLWRTC